MSKLPVQLVHQPVPPATNTTTVVGGGNNRLENVVRDLEQVIKSFVRSYRDTYRLPNTTVAVGSYTEPERHHKTSTEEEDPEVRKLTPLQQHPGSNTKLEQLVLQPMSLCHQLPQLPRQHPAIAQGPGRGRLQR